MTTADICNGLGRRIEKIQYNDSAPLTVTTRYYYDGWRVLIETDDEDAPQRDYAYGNYLDEALFMVADPADTATTYYFAHDRLVSRPSCPRGKPQAPPGGSKTTLSKKQIPPAALPLMYYKNRTIVLQ